MKINQTLPARSFRAKLHSSKLTQAHTHSTPIRPFSPRARVLKQVLHSANLGRSAKQTEPYKKALQAYHTLTTLALSTGNKCLTTQIRQSRVALLAALEKQFVEAPELINTILRQLKLPELASIQSTGSNGGERAFRINLRQEHLSRLGDLLKDMSDLQRLTNLQGIEGAAKIGFYCAGLNLSKLEDLALTELLTIWGGDFSRCIIPASLLYSRDALILTPIILMKPSTDYKHPTLSGNL
jgi:hypothetical protein